MNRLTKEHYPVILDMFRAGGSCHGIARGLDLCRMSVTGVIKRNGLEIRGCKRLPESQYREICAEYNRGDTIAAIAQKRSVSWNVIRRILKKGNLPVRNQERYTKRYSFNIHYFDAIDRPDKAYWLGFLWADGHNNEQRGNVSLSQCHKDREVVLKFQKAVDSNHNLHEKFSTISSGDKTRRYPNTNLLLTNRYFSNRLKDLGMFHDKTWRSSVPQIPADLFFHFLRGFIDGDGSICLNQSKGPQVSFSSHHGLVKEIADKIQALLAIHVSITKSENYSVACISGNKQCSELLWHLYKESNSDSRMSRKYLKYLDVASYCGERARDKTRSNLVVHP